MPRQIPKHSKNTLEKKSVERYSQVMQLYKTPGGGKGSSKNIDG